MSEKWNDSYMERYDKEINELVHFSAKPINTNAEAVGIRLTRDAALNLPYLSLRTLLDDGVDLLMDYPKDGTKVGIVGQINAIATKNSRAQNASEKENEVVNAGLNAARNKKFSIGTEFVDHRLRQILVPKEDEADGYVAITPLAANGLCFLLSDSKQGLIAQHNDTIKDSQVSTIRKLQQAFLKVGGTKTQNVGSLGTSVQRPLMVDAPRSSGTVREAFARYYKGIALNVHEPGPFQETVANYVHFREDILPNPDATNMRNREQEERLIAEIARAVLEIGEGSHEILTQYADVLPQNAPIPNTEPVEYALVAPNVTPVIRGLLDARLRNKDWPRAIAKFTVTQMLAADREGKRLFMLDSAARAHLESLLEEDFR